MKRCHNCNTELVLEDQPFLKEIGVCRHCATYDQNYANLWQQVKEGMKTCPLNLRDVSPHPDATRLTGTRLDGQPDGVHTGGAWRIGNEVWKPLDAGNHLPTQEAEMLEALRDQPLFPANWRIEESNGRKFLVRPFCAMIPGATLNHKYLDHARLLMIEQAIRSANRQGWTVGDLITLGAYKAKLFLVDLSCAHKHERTYEADDYSYIMNFFSLVGAQRLHDYRSKARNKLHMHDIETFDLSRKFIYASFNRPLDGWCNFDKSATLLHEDSPDWQVMTPHSWVITKTALPEEKITSLQLQWGYSSPHAT